MNEKQFLNKYAPLMGKKVNDGFFNTKKLTKTAILNKVVEMFYIKKMEMAYKAFNIPDIEMLLTNVLNIACQLGFEITKEWANFNLLPHSIGNDKIGNDTLCISVNTGILCYMGITGQCGNCKICYAVNSNKMYTMEFIKNSISQLVIIKIMLGKLSIFEVTRNTIYSINALYSGPAVNRLKWLRLNVNGDILNNEMLIIVNGILQPIKAVYSLYGIYSYTHNKVLNLEAVNIVFNTSDFESKKACKTVFNFNIDWLTSDKVILCNGNCNNCPYCKNANERRTVLFMAHGGKFEGLEAVDNRIIAFLEYNKGNDYLELIRTLEGY